MNYDEAVLKTQFPAVKSFIYHLIYHRLIFENYQKRQLKDEFWTLTSDAHLLRATINWCMVFGANSEPTHWKRLVQQSETAMQSFREGLYAATGMDAGGWTNYWTSVTTFRAKFAAHCELEPFSDPLPNFNIALAVAYHYDNWLRHSIAPGIWEEPPLQAFAEYLPRSATPLIDELFRATEMFHSKLGLTPAP